ncbi:MAG: T9SS type A sorting domain-containing protein [Flavobacteriaceae bacterium]|nr:T9SS type A sorting domain-containing protein [Flavobacteriaceae bacterium]
MKKKILLSTFATLLCGSIFSFLHSYPTGAPEGVSGSPNDGANCTSCHGGTAAALNAITHNIPANGYMPDSNYTITVKLNGSGRKGFEFSEQDSATGNIYGSFTIGTGNMEVGTKYITHTTFIGGSSATWQFKWKAPSSGKGKVHFYGAFVIAKPNVYTQHLSIAEQGASTGVMVETQHLYSVFPNPVSDKLFLPWNDGKTPIQLYGLSGKLVLSALPQATNIDMSMLPAGIYLLKQDEKVMKVVKE